MEWPPTNLGPAKRSLLRYLIIVLVAACATWFLRPVISRYISTSKVPLEKVKTQGGKIVFKAPPLPAIAKAEKKGSARKKVEPREVITYRTDTLPEKEAEKIPDVYGVGSDNVVRRPELTASAVAPPWRGETHVRSYLMPDGRTEITLDPQPESFFGFDLKHLELEGGYGIGGKQFDVAASWYPVRLGNVFLGARGDLWMNQDGEFYGSGSIRFKWEPFRK